MLTTKGISRTNSSQIDGDVRAPALGTVVSRATTRVVNANASNDDFEFNLKNIFDKYLNQSVRYEFDIFMAVLVKRQACAKFVAKFFAQIKELVNVLEPKNFESSLLNALFFEIKWHDHHSKNAAILKELADFLIDLSSAYTCYIYKCLTMMVKMFTIGNGGTASSSGHDHGGQHDSSSTASTIDCEAMYRFSHEIINHLVKVAPACKAHLVELVDKTFPYMAKDTFIQENYVKNVLVMAATYKDIRLSLMEICVQKMLKIDVKMTREQIMEAETEAEAEETKEEAEADEGHQPKVPETSANQIQPMKHPLADRLDAMMHQFLSFIRQQSVRGLIKTPSGAEVADVDWDSCKAVYKDLLFIFDNYILCTYGSSHVQFIMFYICSLRSPLSEGFIDYLWKQFSATHSCAIRRQICSYYLGSYLARAKYVPITTCAATLQLIVNWIHAYIQNFNLQLSNNNNNNTSGGGNDLHLHRSFYAMCQTLFYVVVFRHHQLFQEGTDNPNQKQIQEFVRSWNLNDIVTSKLNPLRYVVPTIRNKFARICYVHQVAYCYATIDANNRVSLPVSGQTVNSFNSFYSMTQWSLKATAKASVRVIDDGDKSSSSSVSQLVLENPLDSFFPFDPYLLHRSKSLVSQVYQEFDEALYINNYGDDEDQEDEDEEEDEDDEDEDGEEMDNDNDEEEDDEELIDADDISDHYE